MNMILRVIEMFSDWKISANYLFQLGLSDFRHSCKTSRSGVERFKSSNLKALPKGGPGSDRYRKGINDNTRLNIN